MVDTVESGITFSIDLKRLNSRVSQFNADVSHRLTAQLPPTPPPAVPPMPKINIDVCAIADALSTQTDVTNTLETCDGSQIMLVAVARGLPLKAASHLCYTVMTFALAHLVPFEIRLGTSSPSCGPVYAGSWAWAPSRSPTTCNENILFTWHRLGKLPVVQWNTNGVPV